MPRIYLYSNIPSNGAKDLAHAIGATRLRKFDGMDFWIKNKKIQTKPGDAIICWGRLLPELDELRVLNSGKNLSKIDEMWALVNGGIPTITIANLNKPMEGFIGRSKYHVGGNDLLTPISNPDFIVKQETLVKEYRIHSFNERSIRAGVKQPRDGFTVAGSVEEWKEAQKTGKLLAHPWVRSYDGGWKINYDDFQSTKDLRAIAHNAVKTLKLSFGAVDIGERADGTRLVLEVNKAPGLEGGTLEAYKRAIEKWFELDPKIETKQPEVATKPEAPASPYVNPLELREQRNGRPRWPAQREPNPGGIAGNGIPIEPIRYIAYGPDGNLRIDSDNPPVPVRPANIPSPARPRPGGAVVPVRPRTREERIMEQEQSMRRLWSEARRGGI